MIKGIYHSASAMIPRLRQQEVIANNIANVSTPGFKKDSIFIGELSQAQARHKPVKSDWERPMIDQVYTDYAQGPFIRTGAQLDIAIEGEGFFVVQTADGEEVLLRNGSFTIDELGFVVTSDGDMALGTGGPIQLPAGDIMISDGGVISVNGDEISTLRIALVDDPGALEKRGSGRFHIPDGVEVQDAVSFAVRQGYLESSNVDVITQMVEMIASYRAYEADAQALKSQDQSLEKLISEVGRTR